MLSEAQMDLVAKHLEAIIEGAASAIVSIDEKHDVILFNEAAEQVFGYSRDQVIGRHLSLLLPETSRHRHDTYVAGFAEGPERKRRMATHRGVVYGRRADGSLFPAEVTIDKSYHDTVQVLTATIRDLSTERAMAERLERLDYLSTHDKLTALPNRAQAREWLRDRALATGRPLATVVVDIAAHAAPVQPLDDALVLAVAQRLAGATPPGGLLARLGATEFALVAPGLGVAESHALAETLVGVCHAPGIGAGTGVAVSLPPHHDQVHALEHAAEALVRSRLRGERVSVYDAAEAQRRQALAEALGRATTDGSLQAHYQPMAELHAGRITGFEALVRWRFGGRLLPPGVFLPLAEESDRIIDLDLWMLSRACHDQPILSAAYGHPLHVSVNFSARHFTDPARPVAQIRQALDESGIDPSRLVIEVTETAELTRWSTAVTALRAIRDLGCGIALDDFGTGHASLNYLLDLPGTVLKIDRSYVLRAEQEDPRAMAIVRALTQLCRDMDVRVVAEGIETPATARLLHELGAHVGQGYLWSRPVPLDDARAWLAARPEARP